MSKAPHRSRFLAIFALLTLGACDDDLGSPEYIPNEKAKEFSDADKAAAQALSLGDTQTLETMSDPAAQAQACSRGIESLTQTLRKSGVLTDEQIAALEEARLFYARQVPAGFQEQDDTAQPSDQVDNEGLLDTNPAQDARIALACLRKLDGQ